MTLENLTESTDWVIVGGESGLGARPMKESWVISIRKQCEAAKVPFFFKQWGGVRKSEAGRILEGRTFDDMPERRVRKIAPHQTRLAMMEEVRNWVVEESPIQNDDHTGAKQTLLF
jgi:hypothetical protein